MTIKNDHGKTDQHFTQVRSADPHVIRRREMIKKYPQIKQLYGYDYNTALIMFGVVIAQYTMAYLITSTVAILTAWWVILLLAYLVGATLNHWLAMGVHECTHDLAARTTTQNRWIAILANIPFVIPGAMTFWRYHQDHHTYIGIKKKDNDLPSQLEVDLVGNSSLKKIIWLFLYPFFALFARGFVNWPNKWELVNVLVMTIAMIITYYTLGGLAIVYFALSSYFSFGLNPVGAHYVHEHYLFHEQQETYSYYGPLNRVTFNVGYHNEHHDFFGIPGRRLPELKKMAPEYYETLKSDHSWCGVLWNFITNRNIGHYSRIIRNKRYF